MWLRTEGRRGTRMWDVVLLCVGTCLATAGGNTLLRQHVKDPKAVGSLGYQWEVEGPSAKESRAGLRSSAVRHLLSANVTEETTTAAATTAASGGGDKSIWEEIEDFYSDSNNMAMYCVLPIIILVYGGCSAIYCVYKCRRYFRRRGRHKRLRNEDAQSVSEDERNDLNQEGGGPNQPVKTVSGTTWEDNSAIFADVSYNVERKKTPLPWDVPLEPKQKDMMADTDKSRSRDGNYSAGSRDSTSLALEQERDKLEGRLEVKAKPPVALESSAATHAHADPTTPLRRPPTSAGPRKALEIVPISQQEYQQRQMQASGLWDPLHHRPFDSRASGADTARSRQGRESAWSIREEIMEKYDALTSLAMAKKTANVLRANSYQDNLDNGHRPDTLRRKPAKKKLIFIAE